MRRKVVPYQATSAVQDVYQAPSPFDGSQFFGECYQPIPRRKAPPPFYPEFVQDDFTSAAPLPVFAPGEYLHPIRRKRGAMLQVYSSYIRNDPPVAITGTSADSLRFYFSGAASDGGAQADDNASLGNYRSSTEAKRVGWLVAVAVPGIRIVQASRHNGALGETGDLTVDDDSLLSYAAPGSSVPGPSKSIADGETITLEDGVDPSSWIRVNRYSANDLIGSGQLEFVDQFNNVFGMNNTLDAARQAGENRYRAVFVRNELLINLQSLTFWVGTLGPSVVSSAAQLGSSGAGTIQGAADCFIGWPWRGWARIETSGGSLREIVYYSGRTESVLTVPSLGRGRLGSSAAAGGATDVCYPVPGVRIAWEAASPVVGGSVQTIANVSTAPTGVTWKTGIVSAGGASAGALAGRGQGALWIHREIPAGASACAKHDVRIECEFVVGGSTFRETLAGLFRIEDQSLDEYELWLGQDALPDLTASPNLTSPGVSPGSTELGLLLDPGHTYYIVVAARNRFDLASYSPALILKIDGGGSHVPLPPSAPEIVSWEAAANGTFLLKLVYWYLQDATDQQATQWLIYVRYDGTNPNPSVDTPIVATLVKGAGAAYYEYTSSTHTAGIVGKVLARVRRQGSPNSDSASSEIRTATAVTSGPQTPAGGVFWRDIAEQEQD